MAFNHIYHAVILFQVVKSTEFQKVLYDQDQFGSIPLNNDWSAMDYWDNTTDSKNKSKVDCYQATAEL